MGWVAIGVAVAGMIFTVAWYLVQRRVTRIDLLEQAVFGDAGVRAHMQKFITREHLGERLQEVQMQMRGIREEGQQREQRILDALGTQTDLLGDTLRDVRQDIRSQSARIDAFLHRGRLPTNSTENQT